MGDLDAYLYITISLAQHLQFAEYSSSTSTSSSSSGLMLKGKDLADQLLAEAKELVEDRVGSIDSTAHLSLEISVEDPVVALLHIVLAEKSQVFSCYFN
jgi:hypothetical protein